MRTLLAALALSTIATAQDLRPPSVPLVVHDPYLSIWSPHDRLTDGWPTHWTGHEQRICMLVLVDGKPFRLVGPEPAGVPALKQESLRVDPTTTTAVFAGESVRVTLRFVTPALPDDLELLSQPGSFAFLDAEATDGRAHAISFYVDWSAAVAVDQPAQLVRGAVLEPGDFGGTPAVSMASVEQNTLEKQGDDLRIDWGTAYLEAALGEARAAYGPADGLRRAFLERKGFPAADAGAARRADEGWPSAALRFDCAHAVAFFAYDDGWSIQYFDERLRPYWRRNGAGARELLLGAKRAQALAQRCADFDQRLLADLTRLGGAKWAQLCALAYRQCIGANKLCADANGRPLLFPKENFSNGCIGTVDVIYPMAPLFLLFGPDLAKAMLVPVLDYGSSPRWRFPFAPHDLGTYPHATGQVYGGGERTEENQMPVEESANLLILVAAVAEREGNADFAAQYWPTLERWAGYLVEHGLDPVHQLCTDDFTGHLARNVNLSAKATVALGAWAQLCERHGMHDAAKAARAKAEAWVPQWLELADDGGHTRLAFDKPGTWSQKYNLVWDDVLGLGLFPDELKKREVAHYRKVQNRYGLPLDSRATFTKIDWTSWSACLSRKREDFEALVEPLWRWVNETPERVPICDWFETREPHKINMIARPVIGGLFLRALYERETWAKWYEAGARGKGDWAPLPLVSYAPLAPSAEEAQVEWRFTTRKPADGWMQKEFDDSSWQRGPGGFGTAGTPGAIARTRWDGPEIWLRRAFELKSPPSGRVELSIHHDEDAEVWLNGELAAKLPGYVTSYVRVPIRPEALVQLRAGTNLIAIHCRQTGGGQYVDAGLGLVTRVRPK
jgi:hypothetical protein